MNDNTKEQQDDLDALPPSPRLIRVDGREIGISPITLGQLGPVSRKLRAILPDVMTAEGVDIGALADHTEAIMEVIATVVPDTDDAWLAGLQLDDAIYLIGTWVEVNSDFFSRRVMPRLTRATQAMGAGLGSLPTSSPQDGTTATSSD